MVQLSIEDATRIANKLGEMPANQCYNELTLLVNAIGIAESEKAQKSTKPNNDN
jgi:hypothetical protein